MNIKVLTSNAFRSLRQHAIRSLLTTLGIIIGVVAIISVMSIGEGAKYKIDQQIQKLGTNFLIAISQSQRKLSQRIGVHNPVFTQADVKAIKNEIDEVALISPGLRIPARLIYEGTTWDTAISGVNELFFDIRNWPLTRGSFFDISDIRKNTKVAIIGATVAQELFKTKDPIDSIIRVKNLPFRVIGILTEKGRRPDGVDEDDIIFAPYTTVHRRFVGSKEEKYNVLLMSIKNKDQMGQVTQELKSLFRQTHRIKEDDQEDFTVFSQEDIAQAADASTRVLNLLLMIVASIALLVGGIGIMNIMLVTVTERRREIGIRMALGATTKTILSQFILEAVTICLSGGLIGILIGVAISTSIGLFLGWPIVISPSSLAIALFSSLFIGIFFGYYPASKASKLNPIDALAER